MNGVVDKLVTTTLRFWVGGAAAAKEFGECVLRPMINRNAKLCASTSQYQEQCT